jgi:hypothetical protein
MSNQAPISPAKIHLIVGTSVGTLLVFYTNGHCWQFRVLSSGGEVFGERRIFYTPLISRASFLDSGWKKETNWAGKICDRVHQTSTPTAALNIPGKSDRASWL